VLSAGSVPRRRRPHSHRAPARERSPPPRWFRNQPVTTNFRLVFQLVFLLVVLPFKALFLIIRVFAELLEHAGSHGHRRRRRHHRGQWSAGQVRLFWQIAGVLLVIGLIGSYPIPFLLLAVIAAAVFLLVRRQASRQQAREQQRRESESAAQQAHAQALAALRPEDVEWLRSAGWQAPDAAPVSAPPQ
jgi:hypothetical protein